MTEDDTEASIQTDAEDVERRDIPDEMTEQIEAGYGPMNVYVSGTDNEAVLDSFKEVWSDITDTQERLHEQAQDEDEDGPGGASAFG